jgi:hypothetical protein
MPLSSHPSKHPKAIMLRCGLDQVSPPLPWNLVLSAVNPASISDILHPAQSVTSFVSILSSLGFSMYSGGAISKLSMWSHCFRPPVVELEPAVMKEVESDVTARQQPH